MVDVRKQNRKKLDSIGITDRIKAILAIEEDLENVTIVSKHKWNESLYSKLPTSFLPETEKNAQMINEILIKSWETQGSTLENQEDNLITNDCKDIHCLLMYYFKNLSVVDTMKRVIGVLKDPATQQGMFVHSFLKVGDHIIDNTFSESLIQAMQKNPVQ